MVKKVPGGGVEAAVWRGKFDIISPMRRLYILVGANGAEEHDVR